MSTQQLEGSDRLRLPDLARLDLYVPERPTDGCWIWQGYRHKSGYGQLMRLGVTWKAHRWAYALLVGPIPDGLLLRHTCDTPACVNPEHLIPGTHKDNRNDCASRRRAHNHNTYKTHCSAGHEFTDRNTYVTTDGWRSCRECHRLAELARRKAAR